MTADAVRMDSAKIEVQITGTDQSSQRHGGVASLAPAAQLSEGIPEHKRSRSQDPTRMRSRKSSRDRANAARRRRSLQLTPSAFRSRLRRVNIADSATGMTLFERIWSWKGNTSTSLTDDLVAIFYQFANSIDKSSNQISRVIFELPNKVSHVRQMTRMNQNVSRMEVSTISYR